MAEDILVEIGLEELPARFIDDAEKQFLQKSQRWLDEQRIAYDSITSFSTPRRLAVMVNGASDSQTSIREEVKGPSEKIAKDENGDWTKAAIGFSKGQGKTVDDIYTKDVNGSNYIFVEKQIIGKETRDLLPAFKDIIESISFPKNMRWAEQSLRYARPVRWLVALFGRDVIPFEVADVHTGNHTYGHRFLGNDITLTSPTEYEKALQEQYVIANPQKRQQLIANGMTQLESDHGFHIPEDDELLQEVRNLVEYPTVFTGSFDNNYLKLPEDVLITSMKEHQRYFPVKDSNGDLLPYFISVRNGDDYKLDTVRKGNEKVLQARLSDAQFFFEEDQKQSIDYYLNKLERIVFQEKLGTIGDKVRRVRKITEQLSQRLALDEQTQANALRAADICKFDLPTHMVDEFSNLQGIIGETYARNAGENESVAKAIADHYLPSQADGKLPDTLEGAMVSVADKLDTVVGCMEAGLIPSGSHDPYGLRRQATGLLRILHERHWDITVESLLELGQKLYLDIGMEQVDHEKAASELDQFLKQRAAYLLQNVASGQDITQALLHDDIGVMPYTMAKAKELSWQRNNSAFTPVHEALVRTLNLAGKTNRQNVDPDVFQTASESDLFAVLQQAENMFASANSRQNAHQALQELARLAQPIHAFFEHNMVMSDDAIIRDNRLSLVNRIAALVYSYADLSAIEWKQQFESV
ncbi:glycine--tRNA ligase subunit beta [Lentibacillus halophilus]|uniref:Glycine--tRNA ligase beta subunit n=1 Tax=Lentibacillus halophilus TaxID=295065 RepID=A0ABP3J5T5_9BACI